VKLYLKKRKFFADIAGISAVFARPLADGPASGYQLSSFAANKDE